MIGGSRDELLQALYLVGALRLTIDKLDPLWDPVATGEAPPPKQSVLLGLTYRAKDGIYIPTDWKTEWSTQPRAADLPAPFAPLAGFPASENL